MICKNCNSHNLLKASYCHNCGTAFTQEEKDAARKKTLVGTLETADKIKGKADKINDILSLKFITGNVYVRLALIILPFIFTMLTSGGNKGMGIMDSEEYEIYYNTKTQEYFIDTDQGYVNLQMYIPENTQYVEVTFGTDESNYTVGQYTIDQGVTLTSQSDGYYTITAIAKNSSTQSIVVYTV